MNHLLILLTIAFFITQTLSLKLVRADTFPQKLLTNCFFTLFASLIMGTAGFFFPSVFQIGKNSLCCGILFGILFSLTILFYLSAVSLSFSGVLRSLVLHFILSLFQYAAPCSCRDSFLPRKDFGFSCSVFAVFYRGFLFFKCT